MENVSYFCPIMQKWYAKDQVYKLVLQENSGRYSYILRRDLLDVWENCFASTLDIDREKLAQQGFSMHDLVYKDNTSFLFSLVRNINVSKEYVDAHADMFHFETTEEVVRELGTGHPLAKVVSDIPRITLKSTAYKNYPQDSYPYSLVEVFEVSDVLFFTKTVSNFITMTCYQCSDTFLSSDDVSSDGEHAFCCDSCQDEYWDNNERYDDDYEEDTDWEKRADTSYTGFQSKNATKFGIELEVYLNSYKDAHELSRQLPKGFGLVGDGSLNDRGYEIVSPILAGKKGFEAIKKVTTLLKNFDAYVDDSCGYHLHIEGTQLLNNSMTLKKLISIYFGYEDVITSFIPYQRRGEHYCQNLSDSYSFRDLVEKNDRIEEFESAYYKTTNTSTIENHKRSHYSDFRYYGLNLHSLFAEGHYEIRFHSGTVNYEKITQWIKLHLSILKIAQREDIDKIFQSVKKKNYLKKTEEFFKTVKLPVRSRAYFAKRQKLFSKEENLVESE